jgi:ubiquinone/menaquinone biosynthesis C-methylase UbiE
MINDKVECMSVSKKFEFDYWDGDRKFGYGGYKYIAGRWKNVAKKIINHYNLNKNSSILDIGCGKGFLLYEILELIPSIKVVGIDKSNHAIKNVKKELKNCVFKYDAREKLTFANNEFDLALSLGTFHNFKINELSVSLSEMERVAKKGYLMLESFRNNYELFNLQCWALTAESFHNVDEWIWIYNHFGYYGDYEFIFFE